MFYIIGFIDFFVMCFLRGGSSSVLAAAWHWTGIWRAASSPPECCWGTLEQCSQTSYLLGGSWLQGSRVTLDTSRYINGPGCPDVSVFWKSKKLNKHQLHSRSQEDEVRFNTPSYKLYYFIKVLSFTQRQTSFGVRVVWLNIFTIQLLHFCCITSWSAAGLWQMWRFEWNDCALN